MLKNLICNKNDSLIKVLENIDKNGLGTCFIVDNAEKLCGVVTDGDIRRALLNNTPLNEKIEKILPDNFVFGYEDEDSRLLLTKTSYIIKVIPLVNKNFKVTNYFEYNQNIFFPAAIPNLAGNELKYLTDAFLSSWISSRGEYIDNFEENFSNYCNTKYGIACSNGTTAIHLALLALNITSGDEVIIPDFTFAATINSILYTGATPVIVDIDDSWCIDPLKIIQAITPKTKAIIPVHLYGQSCDMKTIMTIASKYNLKVIEDCAQAHGAMQNNKKVGSFGDIGCFSFFANKIITTGEGGMCVTNNTELNQKMRILRDHGMSVEKKYWHDVIGYNYRITNLQAAIGLAQLERIDKILDNRKSHEDNYKNTLGEKYFTFQKDLKDRTRVTWLVSCTVKDEITRDNYIKKFIDNGIDARKFFYPLSDMKIYKKYCKEYTINAHKVSKIGINLPTYTNKFKITRLSQLLEEISI